MLGDKRLVDRRQKDKRTNALYLTAPARHLLGAMRSRIKTIDNKILMPLTNKERELFMALLTKLVRYNNTLSMAPYEAPF